MNRFDDPQMQGSLRPSFSISSLSPCTTLVPRFTLVSLGNPARRLLVVVKGEVLVVDAFHDGLRVAMPRHGWTRRSDSDRRGLSPPGLQPGTFDHLATSRKLAEQIPVTGSGAAQSLRPISAAASVSSRAASGSVVPLRLCPCASHPVGCGVSLHVAGGAVAHIPGRVHLEVCGAGVQRHTRSGKENRKTRRPGSFAESGPLKNQSVEARRQAQLSPGQDRPSDSRWPGSDAAVIRPPGSPARTNAQRPCGALALVVTRRLFMAVSWFDFR